MIGANAERRTIRTAKSAQLCVHFAIFELDIGGLLQSTRPIHQLSGSDLIPLIDHTFLLPVEAFGGTDDAVHQRQEAINRFFSDVATQVLHPYAVCVRVEDVPHARQVLPETISIVSVAGFPDGCWVSTTQKVLEASIALDQGANEIDMVFNYRAWTAGDRQDSLQDVEEVLRIVRGQGGVLKVILEVSELTFDDLVEACQALEAIGVDFVKTSTGFSKGGATPEAVAILRKNFTGGIKLSGGVQRANLLSLLKELAQDDCLLLDPHQLRIGSSKLLSQLEQETAVL